MTKINVIVDHQKWHKKISNPDQYLKNKIKKLRNNKILKNNSEEFSLLLTNTNKMKKLNLKFRKQNKTTDVLSFSFSENQKRKQYIGDVAINFEIVEKRARKSNFKIEFDKMWVHGYLHLIGYDHKSESDYLKMNKIEKKILNCFD